MLALASELVTGYNIKPGDKVGIAMRNYPELMLAFVGITYMGGVAVPLNALWQTDEFKYAVEDSGMTVLIADPERMRVCSSFLGELHIKSILVRGDAAAAKELG